MSGVDDDVTCAHEKGNGSVPVFTFLRKISCQFSSSIPTEMRTTLCMVAAMVLALRRLRVCPGNTSTSPVFMMASTAKESFSGVISFRPNQELQITYYVPERGDGFSLACAAAV